MSEESFFSMKMAKMSDAELKKYIEKKDEYQDYAVLTAVLELEKRGIAVENTETLKEKLTEVKIDEDEAIAEPIEVTNTTSFTTTAETPELYSTQSIFIFGALFSVFGGGILMALNLFQLNKKNSGWLVITGAIFYSFSLNYIYSFLNIAEKVSITNFVNVSDLLFALFVSVISSLVGVYLLYKLIWEKEKPSNSTYKKRSLLKPVLIILMINLIAGILLMSSGNFPQL